MSWRPGSAWARVAAIALAGTVAMSACGSGSSGSSSVDTGDGTEERVADAVDSAVSGTWRVLSARLFYDEGGGGDISQSVTRRLELGADGTWRFGSSSGAWSLEPIEPGDWARWGVEQYGPQRKIVLRGWAGAGADGPVEESAGVDFLWAIYRADSAQMLSPGVVHMKFGRA